MKLNNFFRKLFWNYIYSGRTWTPAEGRTVLFLNGFSVIGTTTVFLFGIYRLSMGDSFGGFIEVTLSFLSLLNILYLRIYFNIQRASGILLILMILVLTFLLVEGGIAGAGIFWMYTFPVLAFFLFNNTKGLQWNIALLGTLFVAVGFSTTGVFKISYSLEVLRQALFSYLVVVWTLYVYTKFSGINAETLAERTHNAEDFFKKQKKNIEVAAGNTEEALRQKLDIFFRTTGDLVCMANSAGYFTEMNPAFKKVLGYSEEELRRTQFIDFVHPDDILKTKEVIENLALGQGLENFMNRYRRKDGTYVWFMWNATPYDGFIYATARVVDDLVEAREKLEERVRESEEMNRLMVGRELLMAEMKKELAALKAERQAKL